MGISVYEYQQQEHQPLYFCSRKLVISYSQSSLEVEPKLPMTGGLVPLNLVGDGKEIIQLGLSPYQVSRIAQYLKNKQWKGGIMCPRHSWPQCSVRDLSDLPKPFSDPRANLKYDVWGLGFHLGLSDIFVEWVPEDREGTSIALASLSKEAYHLRSLEPQEEKPQIDIEKWKRHLFSTK